MHACTETGIVVVYPDFRLPTGATIQLSSQSDKQGVLPLPRYRHRRVELAVCRSRTA